MLMLEFLKQSTQGKRSPGAKVRSLKPYAGDIQQFHLTIPTMSCGGCVTRVTQAIQKVDIDAQVQMVPHHPHQLQIHTQASKSVIEQAIRVIGHVIE